MLAIRYNKHQQSNRAIQHPLPHHSRHAGSWKRLSCQVIGLIQVMGCCWACGPLQQCENLPGDRLVTDRSLTGH